MVESGLEPGTGRLHSRGTMLWAGWVGKDLVGLIFRYPQGQNGWHSGGGEGTVSPSLPWLWHPWEQWVASDKCVSVWSFSP